jgi:hypothetical protein
LDAGVKVATQQAIDWTAPAGWTPADRELAQELRKRETKEAAILALLRPGAARRSEVKAAGGDRFSARINALRAEGHYIVGPVAAPKWGISERSEPWPDGEDKYILVEPPPEGWRPRGVRS